MEKIKIKVQRVLEGDEAQNPVCMNGFVYGRIPAGGFIVKIDGGISIPIFVRDTDLARATKVRELKGKPVPISSQSWNENVEGE